MNSVSSRPGSFAAVIAAALGGEAGVVDEVDRGLGGEEVAVVFGRPGAAVVDGRAGGGGEASDPVDLDVGELFPLHERDRDLGEGSTTRKLGGCPPMPRARAYSGSRVCMSSSPLVGCVHITRLSPVMPRPQVLPPFELYCSMAEPSGGSARRRCRWRRSGRRRWSRGCRAAVAVRGVDPAVPAPAGIVDHRVGVAACPGRCRASPPGVGACRRRRRRASTGCRVPASR
jgi:hypothetical protein